MRLIDSSASEEWQAILDRCTIYDFHHLPTYTAVEAQLIDSEGKLLVYEESEAVVALPLILRSLATIEGLSPSITSYYDATSVYGYAGPVTNQPWTNRSFFERFTNALHIQLNAMGVIAAFSRLHPVITNEAALSIGKVIPLGETVSIDLTLPFDEQFQLYRKSHRYEVRKARARDIVVNHDREWRYYDDFIDLYHATMRRVNAGNQYFLDKAYFSQLRTALGSNLHLFAAILNGKVISAALFTLVNGIVEYHYSGSSTEELNHGASKLIIDEVRQWGYAREATLFHLGGGQGSQEDSLFLFKAGFSPVRHRFKIWRFLVNPNLYDLAVQHRRIWLLKQGLEFANNSYFPLYRSNHQPIKI